MKFLQPLFPNEKSPGKILRDFCFVINYCERNVYLIISFWLDQPCDVSTCRM
jgi:hypothetical protein